MGRYVCANTSHTIMSVASINSKNVYPVMNNLCYSLHSQEVVVISKTTTDTFKEM